MGLTKQQLELIHEYSAALLTPMEIAILIGLDASKRSAFVVRCRNHEGTPEYEAYQRGRLETKLDLRKNIIKLAKAGSPAAEPMAEKFIKEQTLD